MIHELKNTAPKLDVRGRFPLCRQMSKKVLILELKKTAPMMDERGRFPLCRQISKKVLILELKKTAPMMDQRGRFPLCRQISKKIWIRRRMALILCQWTAPLSLSRRQVRASLTSK
jgi:hypothetical protein